MTFFYYHNCQPGFTTFSGNNKLGFSIPDSLSITTLVDTQLLASELILNLDLGFIDLASTSLQDLILAIITIKTQK